MTEELKPCPFCGHDVKFCDCEDRMKGGGCHQIACVNCGLIDLSLGADPANIIENLQELREEIAVVWNRRA